MIEFEAQKNSPEGVVWDKAEYHAVYHIFPESFGRLPEALSRKYSWFRDGMDANTVVFERALRQTPFAQLLASDVPFEDLNEHIGGTVFCASRIVHRGELPRANYYRAVDFNEGHKPDLDTVSVYRRD